jgi:hypothetical protein
MAFQQVCRMGSLAKLGRIRISGDRSGCTNIPIYTTYVPCLYTKVCADEILFFFADLVPGYLATLEYSEMFGICIAFTDSSILSATPYMEAGFVLIHTFLTAVKAYQFSSASCGKACTLVSIAVL